MKNFEVAELSKKINCRHVAEHINFSIKSINRRLFLKIPLNDKSILLKSRKLNSKANVKMLRYIGSSKNINGGFLKLQHEYKRINTSFIENILNKVDNKLV